jgi:hypothetical protein
MRYLSFFVLLAAAPAVAAQTPSPTRADKIVREPIALTGCVAAGTDKDTYMLTGVERVDARPVGTSGTAGAAPFYWLDSPAKLKGHVGHQVQVTGFLDDDVDKTKVKAKDGKVEIRTEGKKKVEVPEGSAAAAAAEAAGSDTKRASYKVKVHAVTMVAESCAK